VLHQTFKKSRKQFIAIHRSRVLPALEPSRQESSLLRAYLDDDFSDHALRPLVPERRSQHVSKENMDTSIRRKSSLLVCGLGILVLEDLANDRLELEGRDGSVHRFELLPRADKHSSEGRPFPEREHRDVGKRSVGPGADKADTKGRKTSSALDPQPDQDG
jgi:hypothetical protein